MNLISNWYNGLNYSIIKKKVNLKHKINLNITILTALVVVKVQIIKQINEKRVKKLPDNSDIVNTVFIANYY